MKPIRMRTLIAGLMATALVLPPARASGARLPPIHLPPPNQQTPPSAAMSATNTLLALPWAGLTCVGHGF
jgi:hypothetical protein